VRIDGSPHVSHYAKRLEGAIYEPAREEAEEKEDAVVELRAGSSHVDLVEEPVNVEERRRKLPEYEDASVIVDEGALDRG
jgi:hypothetical protein